MSRLNQLGKDSLVYGLGVVLAKGINFFLLPVYTTIFSPTEYGQIEMIVTVTSLLSAILVMGMDSAQSFYFFKYKDEPRLQIELISSIFQWKLTWGVAIVLIAMTASPILNELLFKGTLSLAYFSIAFIGAIFVQLLNQCVEVFRLLYRPWPYLWVTVAHSLFTAIIVLLAVVILNQGVFGYIAGTSIAAILVATACWIYARDYISFNRLYSDWWPCLLKFGVPLLPASIAFYGMSTADRWFIQYFHGDEPLGLYSAAAKFALLMSLVIETFRKAWWPIAMDAMQSEDGPETFRMISRLYMGFGVLSVMLLTFLSPWLVGYFAGTQFFSSWPLVGILSLQSLLYGFYLIASAGIWQSEKTRYSLYLVILAFFVNMLLNYALVPKYSEFGAAIAMVITYGFWIASSMVVSERLWRVNFNYKALIAQFIIGCIYVVFYINFHNEFNVPIHILLCITISFVLISLSLDGKQAKKVLSWIISK